MKNFNTSIDTYANFCDFINNKVYDILKSVKDIHSFEVSFYLIIDGLKYRVNIKDYRNFSISKKNSDGSYETVCSKKIRNNQSLYKHITRHLDDCWYYKKWVYNDMADAIVDFYNEGEPTRIPEEYWDEGCIGMMDDIASGMLNIRQDELEVYGVEIDYDYVWKLARTKQLDTVDFDEDED